MEEEKKKALVDGREMLTFGGTKQGLFSQPQKCLDSRNAGWDLLLYKRAYALANMEQIVCRNVLVHNHLQESETGI